AQSHFPHGWGQHSASGCATLSLRLQSFGGLCRTILKRPDIPTAGLRQGAAVEVRLIGLDKVDPFSTQWAICFQVVILALKVDKAWIATASLATVTLILGAGGFIL
ncbi:MAG TPA: hypothetical protein DIV39_05150, partial [Verrucomicrobiales bacterium]|nr:hypothetical protein [Verrucomicrobiales bacterium]